MSSWTLPMTLEFGLIFIMIYMQLWSLKYWLKLFLGDSTLAPEILGPRRQFYASMEECHSYRSTILIKSTNLLFDFIQPWESLSDLKPKPIVMTSRTTPMYTTGIFGRRFSHLSYLATILWSSHRRSFILVHCNISHPNYEKVEVLITLAWRDIVPACWKRMKQLLVCFYATPSPSCGEINW